MDQPVVPGCVVRARLIGAIEAEQKEKNEGWMRNDRPIAVATHAETHDGAKKLVDWQPHLVAEIKEFFVTYNKLRERKFKPKDEAGPEKARKLIDAGDEEIQTKAPQALSKGTKRAAPSRVMKSPRACLTDAAPPRG